MALCLLLLGFLLPSALGGYLITTPRRWISEWPTQVCVTVDKLNAPAGFLNVTIDNVHRIHSFFSSSTTPSSVIQEPKHMAFIFTTISIPAGTNYVYVRLHFKALIMFMFVSTSRHHNQCNDIQVPATTDTDYNKKLELSGSVSGVEVNHQAVIQFKRFATQTYLQTDKYLYLPGQKVQMRAITVVGPELTISTAQNPEVWVTTPSHTRIVQWKNVTTANGLIHLDMRLIDEPEEVLDEVGEVLATVHGLTKQSNRCGCEGVDASGIPKEHPTAPEGVDAQTIWPTAVPTVQTSGREDCCDLSY
ncbi:hypothetical protein Pmani_012647 [Petrolisthes manimaculis]|uniref:Macroglobulin domain-containing protein n=1 Tax=Petrolisthes manimaculis TaxID=1843537 RepID=A0AAE1PXB4_9EUCA|nr:hypothetical protein Pmani_012647 [Petrolisthes manimaculis]